MSEIRGISKLKQNGTSVFLNNAETSLGLGSGVIVTENGYIIRMYKVNNTFYRKIIYVLPGMVSTHKKKGSRFVMMMILRRNLFLF